MIEPATRIRVAYFVPPSPHFAGVERVVHEIASGLADAHGDQLDVHVIYSTRYHNSALAAAPYVLHVLDVTRLRGLTKGLRRLAKRERFDVFICPQVEPSVMVWLTLLGTPPPVFITHLHGNPDVEEHRGSIRTRCAFWAFRHIVSRRVAGVLAVAPSLRDYAASSVTRHAPVAYAMNPAREMHRVKTDLNTPQLPVNGAPGFRLVNVARLDEQKGIDVLLQAFALALPNMPGATLTLVGSGPLEEDMKRFANELGLSRSVSFAGYLEHPSDAFANADCFVLSSRWEGFPLVLLEALAAGLPVVSTDCRFGPGDLITDPVLGELVPPEDAPGLARGLLRASRRPSTPEARKHRRDKASEFSRDKASQMHYTILSRWMAERSLPFDRSSKG